MARSSYVQLDLDDRRRLYRLRAANTPVPEIARLMGRHRSTIYRELGRNTFENDEVPQASGYSPVVAHDMALRRRRRLRKLVRLPELLTAVIEGFAPLPAEARRSFTFDRGTEFAAWAELKRGLGAEAWFCDPKAPWQKGTVENTNRRIRRWLPRNLDPLALTRRDLREVSERLNATPRKCLGFRTPAEAFRAALAAKTC